MTIREVWYGSLGPLLFDDDDQYPDGAYHAPVYEFYPPINPSDAATKEYVDSVMAEHEATDDPHPQYVKLEGFDPTGRDRGRGTEQEQRHGSSRAFNLESR